MDLFVKCHLKSHTDTTFHYINGFKLAINTVMQTVSYLTSNRYVHSSIKQEFNAHLT